MAGFLVFLGCLIIGATSFERGWAQPVISSSGYASQSRTPSGTPSLPEVEQQLYGHTYMSQPTGQRLGRIERTLFGAIQRGNVETRTAAIGARVQQKNAQRAMAEQGPLLDYLESKLFQRTYSDLPLPERIRRLEVQVFGHPFEHYPLSVRIKKLTYSMPLMAKEIRLTQNSGDGDLVVASTRRKSRTAPRLSQKVEMAQLDATSADSPSSPTGIQEPPLSLGDYSQSVYKDGRGAVVRWVRLPIRVYVKGDAAEVSMATQVIQAWQRSFSVQWVEQSAAADVIVTWDKATWGQNTTGLPTRPVVQVDDRHSIRTIILINLFPFTGQPQSVQLRALSHQLGHAFGLWGHSDNPDDVMYPALPQELNDFPSQWAWRSTNVSRTLVPVESGVGYGPTQRDINTLLKIYALPANSLSDYSPY